MDPRIRIHTKMSWIRNIDYNYVLILAYCSEENRSRGDDLDRVQTARRGHLPRTGNQTSDAEDWTFTHR
jgi:hypothetical protein